jgi:integrase
VLAILSGGLRRGEVLGLRLVDVQVTDRRVFIVKGKGGHHRVVPVANHTFRAGCRRTGPASRGRAGHRWGVGGAIRVGGGSSGCW